MNPFALGSRLLGRWQRWLADWRHTMMLVDAELDRLELERSLRVHPSRERGPVD